MKTSSKINENDFFRQATLNVCGHLNLEMGLFSCFQYLKEYIPLDRMFIDHFDEELGVLKTIAVASPAGGKKLNLISPVVKDNLDDTKPTPTLPGIYIYNKAESDLFCRNMMRIFDIEGSCSAMYMDVALDGKLLGFVVLGVRENNRYSPQHAQLLSLLKEPFATAISNALKHNELMRLKDLLADDRSFLQGELSRFSGNYIVGEDFGLKKVMEKVYKVAPLNSPVLLTGETGVGKDIIANVIHQTSNRKNGPFISVNCGALPETLVDSELFGHEKGAFTGASVQTRGRFERAHQGTIFLDEIGELTPQAQIRLLRVLQHKMVERVGASRPINVDVRIIAATHKDLEEMIINKQFREDLWFRLNVFPITIPPLRDRKLDIPSLVDYFIRRKSKELRLNIVPKLSSTALDQLIEYSWPGNVRELENIIERALILNGKEPLSFEHLDLKYRKKKSESINQKEISKSLDTVVSDHIKRVLDSTKGKINGPNGAAEILRVHPNTLRFRIKKLGIPRMGKEE